MVSEALRFRGRPPLQRPTIIAAFSGWPDAAQVASTALRFLVDRLDAGRFGEIDPEWFFDFSEQRPTTSRGRLHRRRLRWPVTELYGWQSPDHEHDLILLIAPEPHLRWRGYSNLLMQIVESYDARLFITLGGTFDSVPHTGPAKVSGWSNSTDWTQKLRDLRVPSVEYEGPTAFHSALLDACDRRSLPAITLWGHAPQYVRSAPNAKVCHATLDRLRRLLDLDVNLDRLRGAALALEERVNELLRDDPKLAAYVREIEQSVEADPAEPADPREPLDPGTIVRELEDFLREGGFTSGESDPDDSEGH